ncbi:MAG TPA: UDP-N-acetylmuramate dehydrogenase [Ferruginibacter sp.]|nr:UDP-N-acetylmuramate dehydrogenase [Ferruginibacter sp.]
MEIQSNISLKKYNTFGIDAHARYFSKFTTVTELNDLLDLQKQFIVLGGGSNILFTKDYDGLVLKNELKGIKKLKEDEHHVYVQAGAGENWHQFVLYCITNNLAGIENLSLIPGCVGASPMQNIGAYGVEIKDVLYSLEAYSIKEKTLQTFSLNDCELAYRDSIFKRKYKNEFVITSVTYRLNKQADFNTSYGAIKHELEKMQVNQLTIKNVSQAVINIRNSKLPDPAKIGNAGSFFKNPTVSRSTFEILKNKFHGIVGYDVHNGDVKLAAGWLIEQCGWKGFRKEDAGCYDKQALVLVNYGNATGEDIYNLSEDILQSVKEKFGVLLEREVNIL